MKKVILMMIGMIFSVSAVCAGAQVQDGLCKVFLGGDDGFLFVVEMQRHALRDGVAFQFDQNGEVEKIAWYEKGILSGTFRSFWSDGQLKSILPYHSGMLDGVVKRYDRQGRPQMALTYVRGRLNGMGYYYEEGMLKNTVTYEKGRAVKILDEEAR